MAVDDKQMRMQRIRVGLTGLAAILLTIAAAAAIFESTNRLPANDTGVNGVASVTVAQKMIDNAAQVPNEPLAEIGVAPGTETTDAERKAAGANPPPRR